MKTILVFGNPHLKDDSLAIEIARDIKLPGFKFVECARPDDLFDYDADKVYIMDVVKGLNQVELITDIEKIKEFSSLSLHDFDLGYFLKLMMATGKISGVRIVGLPFGADADVVKQQVKELLLH